MYQVRGYMQQKKDCITLKLFSKSKINFFKVFNKNELLVP